MQPEINDNVLETRIGEIFARRWSVPGDKAPVVLLHDSLGSVEQWREFPALLAVKLGRSVVAYDRPGFGRSEVRVEIPGPDFIDLEARVNLPVVLEALKIERYILLGHSVGGAMAIAAAGIHPAYCLAVVTESAQSFVEERTLAGIRAAKQAFLAPGEFARIEKWHGKRAGWALSAWTEVWLSAEFRAWSLKPYFQSVMCPVLAIHGENDEFGSEAFPCSIVGGVRGPGEMRLLENCGHVPHREHAREVIEIIADFLGRRLEQVALSC